MAYQDDRGIYAKPVLHFSENMRVAGLTYSYGDAENNNVLQIRSAAKALADKGDESCGCGDNSCFCKKAFQHQCNKGMIISLPSLQLAFPTQTVQYTKSAGPAPAATRAP